jgi:AcrR family transcriptional regulator
MAGPMDTITTSPRDGRSRRNKTFVATHQVLIEAAVRLISAKGIEALSVAELARSVEMNRATVYYHFESREQLVEAVAAWSSQQLALGFAGAGSQSERIDFIARFVLANPDLLKLWIEQLITPGDIRTTYPRWDELVAATRQSSEEAGVEVDAEVHCALLVAGAIIGPRVFRNSIRPDLDDDTIVERFRAEQQRMLARDGLLRGSSSNTSVERKPPPV